jgi:hypothetical protein
MGKRKRGREGREEKIFKKLRMGGLERRGRENSSWKRD